MPLPIPPKQNPPLWISKQMNPYRHNTSNPTPGNQKASSHHSLPVIVSHRSVYPKQAYALEKIAKLERSHFGALGGTSWKHQIRNGEDKETKNWNQEGSDLQQQNTSTTAVAAPPPQDAYQNSTPLPKQNSSTKQHMIDQVSPLHVPRLFQMQSIPDMYQHLCRFLSFPHPPPMTFSNTQQSRYFFVSSFEDMFEMLMGLKEEHRCLYEVIREEDSCFLYLDVERNYTSSEQQTNSDSSPSSCLNPPFQKEHQENVVDKLIHHLEKELMQQFGSSLFRGDGILRYTVDMDSSTESKFSRHIVVRLKNKKRQFVVWRDNRELGNFVKNWIQHMFQQEETRKLFFYQKPLERAQESGPNSDSSPQFQWKCIIDDAVYTKNRAFRLLGNSKYGKKAFLRVTPRTYSNYKVRDDIIVKPRIPVLKTMKKSRQWFMRSLVTCVPVDPTKVQVLDMPLEKCAHLEKASDQTAFFKQHKLFRQHNNHKYPPPTRLRTNYAADSCSLECLSHAKLDDYLLNLIPEGNAFIRSIKYFSQSDMLIYEIGGNRYCHNIRRQHKSNHVYYIAHLLPQTIVQKCTDPDCASFRSAPYNYPADCQPIRTDLDYGDTPQFDRTTKRKEKSLWNEDPSETDSDHDKNNSCARDLLYDAGTTRKKKSTDRKILQEAGIVKREPKSDCNHLPRQIKNANIEKYNYRTDKILQKFEPKNQQRMKIDPNPIPSNKRKREIPLAPNVNKPRDPIQPHAQEKPFKQPIAPLKVTSNSFLHSSPLNSWNNNYTQSYSLHTPPPLEKFEGACVPSSFSMVEWSSDDDDFLDEIEKLEKSLGVKAPPKKKRRKHKQQKHSSARAK